jgi:hypothetical protein
VQVLQHNALGELLRVGVGWLGRVRGRRARDQQQDHNDALHGRQASVALASSDTRAQGINITRQLSMLAGSLRSNTDESLALAGVNAHGHATVAKEKSSLA